MTIKFSMSMEGGFDALHVEGGPCSQPPRDYVVDSVIIDGRIVRHGDGTGATVIIITDTFDKELIEDIWVFHNNRQQEHVCKVHRRAKYEPTKLSHIELHQSFIDWFEKLR